MNKYGYFLVRTSFWGKCIITFQKEGKGGGSKKPHNKMLYNSYLSPVIIRVIMSKWIGWAGHVASMVDKRNSYRSSVVNLEGL